VGKSIANGRSLAKEIFNGLKTGLSDALVHGPVKLQFCSKKHGMLVFDLGKRVTASVKFQCEYELFVGAIVRKLHQETAGLSEGTRGNKVRWVLGAVWWLLLSAFRDVDGQSVSIGDIGPDVSFELNADGIRAVVEPDDNTTKALYDEVMRVVRVNCEPFRSRYWLAFEKVDRLGVTAKADMTGGDTGRPGLETTQMYLAVAGEGEKRSAPKRAVKNPKTAAEVALKIDRAHAQNELTRCRTQLWLETEVGVLADFNVELTIERDGLKVKLRETEAELEEVEGENRRATAERVAAVREVEKRLAQAHRDERERDKQLIEQLRHAVEDKKRMASELEEKDRQLGVMIQDRKKLKCSIEALREVKDRYKATVDRLERGASQTGVQKGLVGGKAN
jgi:hypothetical protein